MTTQTCYNCGHKQDVEHDEPGRCPQCNTWNQSERFKAELRASIDLPAHLRVRYQEDTMPRPKRDEPKVRLNLEMSRQTKERLDRLVEWTDAATMSEVVRKAIEVLNVIEENKSRGGTLFIKNADGTTKELILL